MQLPKRLARRLMDLQYLPHIVVINPHIRFSPAARHLSLQFVSRCGQPGAQTEVVASAARCRRVYNAYRHAFNVLRSMPQVQTAQDNAQLTLVLQRLVDEHGAAFHLSDRHPLRAV